MLMAIGGCSNEVPYDQVVLRNGIFYEVNSQTPFTGSSVEYHENGQLSARRLYKDGKREGLAELYYENGQLWVRENYKDGKLDGLHETYYENGQLRYKRNYKDGKRID